MPVLDAYPVNGLLIRGDPLLIRVDIAIAGVPQDVSAWTWRAHVRRSFNAALMFAFAIEVVVPPGGDVASRLHLTLTADQTTQLKTGFVWDLEQRSPTQRTWLICKKLVVQQDVSHE
jgi:hypothetical protein